MKAVRHPFNEVVILVASVILVLLAIPALAAGAFVLRAAFLVAVPVALIAGIALWVTSARFRSWFRTETGAVETYKGLRLATDVALDRGHAWARRQGATVVVGADDLLATVLGPVQSVDLPPPGREVVRGEVLFRLTRGHRALEVRSPVGGTVLAANDALARDPELVNADPFRRGWAVRLGGVLDFGREPQGLRRGQDALAWFRTDVDRVLATVLGDVAAVPAMADGGLITGDIYERIDDRAWERVKESLGGARS